jgi:hypothetical protein
VTLSAEKVLGPFGGVCPAPDRMGRWTTGTSCLNARPDPLRKDVYLELDWQDCEKGGCPGGESRIDTLHHAPHGEALEEVRNLFEQTGAKLHIQIDENVRHQPNCIQPHYPYYKTETDEGYPPSTEEHHFGTRAQREPPAGWVTIRQARLRSVRYVFSGHSVRDMRGLQEPGCPTPFWFEAKRPLPNYDLSPFGMVAQGGNLIVMGLGPLWICGSHDPEGERGHLGNFGRCLNEDRDLGIFPARIEGELEQFRHPIHLMLGERERHAAKQLWALSLAKELGKALGLSGTEAGNDPVQIGNPSSGVRTPKAVEPYARWNLDFALKYPVNPSGWSEREPLPNYDWLKGQDPDGDTWASKDDNCPSVPNHYQENQDGDPWGDVCDRNIDGDSQPNATADDDFGASASAASEPNYDPYPYDTNNDGEDNAVDPDDDGDGVLDPADNCVLTANASQADVDSDGVGDSCDRDADGDGVDRAVEDIAHSDPLSAASLPEYVGYADSCSNGSDDDGDGAVDAADSRCADGDGDGYADVDDLCPSVEDLRNGDEDADGFGDPCDLAVAADGVWPPRLGALDDSVMVLFDTTAADSYQVRIGGTSCSTGQVLASGSPSGGSTTVGADLLPEGTSTLRICATARGETVEDSATVVRDLHAPVVAPPTLVAGTDSGASASDGVTNAAEPVLGGNTEPGANVIVYEGVRVIGRPQADSTGAWAFPLAGRASGTYTFTAMAYDDAGNIGAMSQPATVVLDRVLPAGTIDPPPVVLVPTQTVSGTATDDLSGVDRIVVTLTPTTVPGSPQTVYPTPVCTSDRRSCTWSVPVPLVPGNYDVDVEAKDTAGNVEFDGPTRTILIG